MRRKADFGEISDNVYYFSGFEDDVGAGFVATEEGIVVIDTTMLPTSAKTLLGIIESIYQDKVIAIINTHVHADHHFGNEVFLREFPQSEIVAHQRFLGILEEWALESGRDIATDLPNRMMQREDMIYYRPYFEKLRVIPPSRTVASDLVLHFGRTKIQLVHTPGHTEDLLTVYLPKERVLFASDCVYPTKRIPVLFMGDPDAWIESLEKLLRFDVNVLLPGHGWIPENPQAEIRRHIDALKSVKEKVIKAIPETSGTISYAQLEKQLDFPKGRNLLGVIQSLVKRGILEADSEDLLEARLRRSARP